MGGRPSVDLSIGPASYATTIIRASVDVQDKVAIDGEGATSNAAIPITISPALPTEETEAKETEKHRDSSDKKNGSRQKRSSSIERGDTSKSKKEKVQKMLKTGVHKGQERITTISRKIGHGVARGGSLRRANSTPGDVYLIGCVAISDAGVDLHAILHPMSYQASSIHSRRRVSSIVHSHDGTPAESPTPPPPPPVPPVGQTKIDARVARENKMLSNVWLMSAATFRRLGKIEQAKGAIQEAEVRDESNPAVWVQVSIRNTVLQIAKFMLTTVGAILHRSWSTPTCH